MRKKQKWLVGLLSTAIAVSPGASVFAADSGPVQSRLPSEALSDISGHWAQSSVEKWAANGVLGGYPNGMFYPNQNISRAEFVTILNRVFGFYVKSDEAFSDVNTSSWYADQLSFARQAGIYQGFPGNKAEADTNITIEDAITMLARLFELQAGSSASGKFNDSSKIQAYAKDAVNALSGVLNGYQDGTLRPTTPITRAEAVTLINNLVAGYYTNAGSFDGGTVSGNVVVNNKGVVLKNATVNGNLYLTAGIGDGEVTLDGVSVTGTTFIEGGGANTIVLNNSTLGEVVVNRKEGQVHVQISGYTHLSHVSVNSSAKLDFSIGTTTDSVDLNQPSSLDISGGATINGLNIAGTATGSTITGQGSMNKVNINASGVTVNGKSIDLGTAVIVNGIISNASSSTSGSHSGTNNGPDTASKNFVDAQATGASKSLFDYLEGIRGNNILFGQQHATDEGQSITVHDGTQSDVYNDVGEHPAVFGWDTLSLEGKEKPGVMGDFTSSRDNLISEMKQAYNYGGILTLSSHMPNFVTGGDFYDLKGSVVSHILPGGDKNADFNAFLDNIADFAIHLKDDNGNSIPVIYRPFHEMSGSWFWWGAAFTTTDQYKELYRYTVEYLRDKKGVHNFLYAYSPGGGFGSNKDQYLSTYPGDDYVDILGFDSYYNTGNGDGYFTGLAADAKTVSQIADQKHKVAALTEFGYQNMLVSGNDRPTFFTDMIKALQADPDARKMAFMLTWADFTPSSSSYVPYPTGTSQEHQMMADFKSFYNDPYTLFSEGVTGAYDRTVTTEAEQPFMHIASPTDQETISNNTTTIRARVLNETPASVVYTIGESATEIPMTLDADSGFYMADWSPAAQLNGKSTTITVKVYDANHSVLQSQTNTVFVKISEVPIATYTFDNDISGVQNNGGYQATVDSISQAAFNGSGALNLSVSGVTNTDTWQEMKLELQNAKTVVGSDTLSGVMRIKLDAWVPVSAASSTDATLRAVVQLPQDWDTKYGMDSTTTSFADLPKVTIDGVEYVHFTPTIDLTDAGKRATADDIAISIVGSGLDSSSGSFPVYMDNIGLYSTYADEASNPNVVDDFEGYMGSDTALGSKFVHAGGDATSVSLSNANKSGGSYAMKFDYTLGSNGYAGITKNLGVDWSGNNALKLYLTPDGSNQKLVIQLNVNGVSFEVYPSLASTTPGWVSIPFREFAVAPWDTSNAGKKITQLGLKNVQSMSIYVNAVDNAEQSGSLYFDDISAINDPSAGTVPVGSVGGPIATGELFGFNSDAQGWVFGGNTLNATSLIQSSDPSDNTIGVLQADYPFDNTPGNSSDLNYIGDKDLSGGNTLKMRVRLSAGSAKAKLFIKSGSGWTWANSDEWTLGTDYQWLTLNLNGNDYTGMVPIDKTLVKAMGIEIYSTSGAGTVYVDEVMLE
ncbi:glycosyl hydrolase [Paenibacillus sp. YAF4_2]|uniref:glycosyl hydrolase n=1 Tax=Paenibacillus sp. YAF4_2 TaxID=3233085 RepID=UPI003F9E8E5E